LDLHAPERRGNHPTHRAFHPPLLFPATRAASCLLFPLSYGLLQRLSHGLLPCFLDLLLHFLSTCGCRQLDFERYLNLHERSPSVIEYIFIFFHRNDLSPFF
jgi:hypothetical protein